MWQIWLVISGICIILEIITVGFFIFWFAIGALFAMLVSFFTNNLIIQTCIFLITSTLLIFITKPFIKKFAVNNSEIKTNIYSIIGKTGIVIKDINPEEGLGQVKIDGEVWSANANTTSNISKGTKVEVKNIKGVKVIVAPKN